MFGAIVPIILIIVSALVGFFNISPLYKSVVSVKKEVNIVENSLQKIKEVELAVKKLNIDIENISSKNKDKLDVILPDSIDQIRFLNMLTIIAARRDLVLSNLKISNNENNNEASTVGSVGSKNEISTINISFSTTASYEVFKKLMNDLESSLVLMDIKSVTLSRSSAGNSEGSEVPLYTYGVELTTYILN